MRRAAQAGSQGARQTGTAHLPYQEAVRILDKLAKDRSDVPQYQGDLARTYDKLAFLYDDEHENAKAEEAFRKALPLWEKLAGAHPHELDYALNLLKTRYNLGNLLKAHADFAGAID